MKLRLFTWKAFPIFPLGKKCSCAPSLLLQIIPIFYGTTRLDEMKKPVLLVNKDICLKPDPQAEGFRIKCFGTVLQLFPF